MAVPAEVVERVLDNSTALGAIESGIWEWLPLVDDLDDTDTIFECALSLEQEGR